MNVFFKVLKYWYYQNDLQQRFNSLEQGVTFRVWELKRVSVSLSWSLNRVRVQEASWNTPIQNLREYPPPSPGSLTDSNVNCRSTEKHNKSFYLSQKAAEEMLTSNQKKSLFEIPSKNFLILSVSLGKTNQCQLCCTLGLKVC